jgi:hypothetical protein
VAPGASSDPQSSVAASANSAYVALAPGYDPHSSAMPTALVVLRSHDGFALQLNQTLHIPVDDAHFDGNCAAGSTLPQAEADFITSQVFAADFAGLVYDSATCTSTSAP